MILSTKVIFHSVLCCKKNILNSGIGRGIALQLGAAGATVYITGRTADRSDRRFNSSFPSLETTANGNSIFSVLVYAYPGLAYICSMFFSFLIHLLEAKAK